MWKPSAPSYLGEGPLGERTGNGEDSGFNPLRGVVPRLGTGSAKPVQLVEPG